MSDLLGRFCSDIEQPSYLSFAISECQTGRELDMIAPVLHIRVNQDCNICLV